MTSKSNDFLEIIKQQRESSKQEEWTGTALDYLQLIENDSKITSLSPSRIFDLITSKGTTDLPDDFKIRGYDDVVQYNFFKDKIFGSYEAIHDIVKFLKAAANRTETGKRILILIGPVSSGKSTLAAMIKKGLEFEHSPIYAIDGCPINEDPIHLIPERDREFWEERLGIRIEGNLCPVCWHKYENAEWESVPVKRISLSEQNRRGIATFAPTDSKCVKYDTLVFTDKGLLTMEEIQSMVNAKEDEIIDVELTVSSIKGKERASNFYNNGIQEINKIKTTMGYDIECTNVHPLLVLENGKMIWKQSKNIEDGDFVAVQVGQNLFPEKCDITTSCAKVLGYLVGDGSITKRDIWMINHDERIINDYIKNFELAFNKTPHVYQRQQNGNITSQIYLGSDEIVDIMINKYGMKRGAYNKSIPHVVRKGTRECVISFLEGLFWSDGHVSTRKICKSNKFMYGTVSKLLAKEVQLMLLNLGVPSFLKSNNMNYNRNKFYTVNVSGDSVIDLFSIMPGLIDKKTDDGNFIQKRDSSNWNFIPNCQLLFEDALNRIVNDGGVALYKTDFAKYRRHKSYDEWSRLPKRSSVIKFVDDVRSYLGKTFDSIDLLEEYAKNDNIIWTKVKSNESNGISHVYDLTVPESHSFCANGIINHNSQDVSELIGRVNMSKLTRYGETDPRAYQFDGELQVANRGLIEMIELLKCDIKLQYVLITAAQEQLIKSPGFPQMYIDTLILAHSNETEFNSFKSDKKNEALHDRMYVVKVPWNLRLDDEVKIYKKLINNSNFKNVHVAPNTLEVAAMFAVMSRLIDSTEVSSKIEKMKLYNGEISKLFKKNDIDVKKLYLKGREAGEGMSGISPRFIVNALNLALAKKQDIGCINPIDVIRAMASQFDHHIGITEEDKKRYMDILGTEKDSVRNEFNEIAMKEVNKAFISAYDDQAEAMFDNYLINARAYCKKEMIEDIVTGEFSEPDESLLRSIEELIPVPSNAKSEFRNGIFVFESEALREGKSFGYKDYPPIKDAIEKKLLGDLKNVMSLTLVDRSMSDKKKIGRKRGVIKRLIDAGYCEHCANVIITYVSDILRKNQGS